MSRFILAFGLVLFGSIEAAHAARLRCQGVQREISRGAGQGRDQDYVLCQDPTTGVFTGYKLKRMAFGRVASLVRGVPSKDPRQALAGVNGLNLPTSSAQYKVSAAAGDKAREEWRKGEYGDIASDKAKKEMDETIEKVSQVLAIGNEVVRVGAGGNTQCTWSFPSASKVEANAGMYDCGRDKFCQRPVKCKMTVGNQSFDFESNAKCKLSAGQTCEQEANACAAQNFNEQKGLALPGYDPSKQTTGGAR